MNRLPIHGMGCAKRTAAGELVSNASALTGRPLPVEWGGFGAQLGPNACVLGWQGRLSGEPRRSLLSGSPGWIPRQG